MADSFGGYVFTPEPKPKELTPEEIKERAISRLDMSLDSIIKESYENGEHKKNSGKKNRSKDKKRGKEVRKVINLDLTDREIQRYLCFTKENTAGSKIKLRIVLESNK